METEITPKEAKEILALGKAIALDVREKEEIEFASIGEHTWIRLGELEKRFSELPRGKKIIVVCRSGSRSATATDFLRDKGFNAVNLAGGILAWGKQVDKKVKPYTYSWRGENIIVAEIK